MLSLDILRDAATLAQTTPAILRSPCRHATTICKRRKVAVYLAGQGLSVSRIARLLNRDETTARRYVNRAYADRQNAKMLAKYHAGRHKESQGRELTIYADVVR